MLVKHRGNVSGRVLRIMARHRTHFSGISRSIEISSLGPSGPAAESKCSGSDRPCIVWVRPDRTVFDSERDAEPRSIDQWQSHPQWLGVPLGLQMGITWYNYGYIITIYGGFHKWGYPKIDGLQWNTLLKWMIWGYPYFRKPPYIHL